MVKIDKIQQAILRLDGGAFQQIMNAYLYKKYKFTNITCLGSEAGSSKPTKGTPDTYVELDNGKYILIMYGAVNAKAFQKLKEDIMSAYNIDKTYIDESKILGIELLDHVVVAGYKFFSVMTLIRER